MFIVASIACSILVSLFSYAVLCVLCNHRALEESWLLDFYYLLGVAVIVLCLFLIVWWVGLCCVIGTFLCHSHLLFNIASGKCTNTERFCWTMLTFVNKFKRYCNTAAVLQGHSPLIISLYQGNITIKRILLFPYKGPGSS